MASLDTEIRKLSVRELYYISRMLDESKCWKRIMAIIPNDEDPNQFRFSNDDIETIERAGRLESNPASIFLSEWSTMGKKRPTLRILQKLLVQEKLFKIADYIATNILKCEIPRRPSSGPAAKVDISDAMLAILRKEQQSSNSSDFILPEMSKNSNSLYIRYAENTTELAKQEKISQFPNLISLSQEKLEPLKLDEINDVIRKYSADMIKFSTADKIDESSSFVSEDRLAFVPPCAMAPYSYIEDSEDKSNIVSSIESTNSMAISSDIQIATESSADISSQMLPACIQKFAQNQVVHVEEDDICNTNTSSCSEIPAIVKDYSIS